MTEEEINNLAEKHCNEVLCNAHEKCYEVIKCRDWRLRRAGFFCGYEQAVKDIQQENNKLLDVINNQDVKVADLEKENAELKEKLEHRNCLDCSNHDSNIKLTKAKEIIKSIIEFDVSYEDEKDLERRYELFDKIIEEAKQFIKEIEK